MKVIEYINKHRQDEDDCECIILPDGTLEEARPSHIEMLGEIAKKKTSVFNTLMEKDMEPLFWMVQYTQCISVWKTRILAPVCITKKQETTLEILKDTTFLGPNYLMQHVGKEYEDSVEKGRKLLQSRNESMI